MAQVMARPSIPAFVVQRRRRLQDHYEGKDIENASSPDWVYGCGKCRYGIVKPPDANIAAAPLYLIRTFQAAHQRLEFCTCRAGNLYRQYLRRAYGAVKDGSDHVPAATVEMLNEAVTTPTVNGERVTA